jgi:hypothetical protein
MGAWIAKRPVRVAAIVASFVVFIVGLLVFRGSISFLHRVQRTGIDAMGESCWSPAGRAVAFPTRNARYDRNEEFPLGCRRKP